MKNLRLLKFILLVFMVSCGGGSKTSISILPSKEKFSQGNSFNLKLDILWVVDPSRSMFEETERVKANIASFMKDIVESGYEYRMGVLSTAAWSDLAYQADNSKTFLSYGGASVFNKLHQGECTDHSASLTANPYLSYLSESSLGLFLSRFNSYFDMYGSKLNTSGCGLVGPPFGNYGSVSGNFFEDTRFNSAKRAQLWQFANDERPLQSMKAFLSSTGATQFLRSDAYLAVILISDEPDGSRNDLSPSLSFDQSSGNGHQAPSYLSFLDQLKGSRSKYGVYSIIKTDGSNNLDHDVAIASGGKVVNIDASSSEYKRNLASIKDSILRASSIYPLSAQDPVEESFVVKFIKKDGTVVNVPKDTGSGGFKYLPGVNSLQFNPPFVPDKGDVIDLIYDKASLADSAEGSLPYIQLSNNKVSEGAAVGTLVGNLSLENTDEREITYSLLSDTSDPDDQGPDVGAFSVSSDGKLRLTDPSKLDKEQQALHSLRVSASNDSIGRIERDLTLILQDVVDALPIAHDDLYTRSEKIADASGQVKILGNLSYNDTGLDSSEKHTYTALTLPLKGTINLSSTGEFSYSVSQSSLSLSSGDTHNENISYKVVDASGNESTAQLKITVEGANEAPVLITPIADQNVNIAGGEQQVSINTLGVSASGFSSGSASDLVDGNLSTSASSSASTGAHYIELPFSGSSFFEISRLEINGAHEMGNSVFQILSESGDVLSREVLEIDNGSDISVSFSTAAIGKKVKIIRPEGAVNTVGDQNIQIKEFKVYGYEASLLSIDLSTHFTDPDGDAMSFVATDKYGEGAAPGWIKVTGSTLTALPPAGADVVVGVLAEDTSGDSVFETFRITRSGGASNINNPPLALLDIDDTQRGGLSLKRWGGDVTYNSGPDLVTHDESDEFLDQVLDDDGNLIPWVASDFDHWGGDDGHPRGSTDGWNHSPTTTNDKYARNGRLIPFINSERKYGEFYSGYFVPAKTGYYRFRTTSLDDVVRLLLSPSEYFSDLEKIISATINTEAMKRVMADTVRAQGESVGILAHYNLSGDTISNCLGTVFFPNSCGGPHDTSRFFLGGLPGYDHGLVHLTKGNVYAVQVRFMEGGGAVAFDFEYDYRDSPSGSWTGWKPIDASVVIPKSGTDSYSPRKINAVTTVNFDASQIFYDAEQDTLEYGAKLVLPDGTDYIGPGGTSQVSELGLSFNISSGLLSGSLDALYDGLQIKPRIQFKAKEKFASSLKEVSSLAIKIER